jgi:Domain of unknown function (DUF4062)/inactive STAND
VKLARIYVSSSYEDLRKYRRRVAEKIRELGHVAIGMEADGAQEERPLDVCLRQVRSCDGYIGLIGLRYGSSPWPECPHSYTELEYEAAAACGKRMLFVARPEVGDLQFPYRDTDPEQIAKLEAFRTRVATHSIGLFSSIAELAEAVHKGILTNFGMGALVPPLLPHLCDRQPQEHALTDAFAARLPERPVLLVAYGDRREAQSQYIERLRVDSLPKLLDLSKTDTVSHYRLTWPETARDRADIASWLTRELVRVVIGGSGRRSATLVDVFRQLAATRMPTLVSVSVDCDRWGIDEARSLSSFIGFWQRAPDYSSVYPLVVCLAISYPVMPSKARWWSAWLDRRRDPAPMLGAIAAPAPPAITLGLLPRLGEDAVSRQQVHNWLDRNVRPLLTELHLDEGLLLQRIEEMFAAHEAASKTSLIPMGPLADGLVRAMQASRRVPTNGALFE